MTCFTCINSKEIEEGGFDEEIVKGFFCKYTQLYHPGKYLHVEHDVKCDGHE